MQKKAVRIVTKSKKLDPTGPLFEEIDVLPFENLCFKANFYSWMPSTMIMLQLLLNMFL